jgi:formiminoglutamase
MITPMPPLEEMIPDWKKAADPGPRVGDVIQLPEVHESAEEAIERFSVNAVRHCILGIPEDLGVRAYRGRPGADKAWSCFVENLLSLQSNRFIDWTRVGMLGVVECSDLMEGSAGADRKALSGLVDVLDDRVGAAVRKIQAAGLCPIVVGGGHNNSFPIIKASAGDSKISVLNIDAHADFEAVGLRHSGNPYSYADQAGLIRRFGVAGLHEQDAPEAMLKRLDERGWQFVSLEQIHLLDRRMEQARMLDLINYVAGGSESVGVDVDLDVLSAIPSSAENWVGLPLDDVMFCLKSVMMSSPIAYLHICEGAPGLGVHGDRTVGQVISHLVSFFLRHDLRL